MLWLTIPISPRSSPVCLPCCTRGSRLMPGSELLHPGAQLDLPRPGAARLVRHLPVGLGDGVGIEETVRVVVRILPAGTADPAVDYEMRDMHPLRRQLARHAGRQPAQRELAHRE